MVSGGFLLAAAQHSQHVARRTMPMRISRNGESASRGGPPGGRFPAKPLRIASLQYAYAYSVLNH
jgi:hypothetical protein